VDQLNLRAHSAAGTSLCFSLADHVDGFVPGHGAPRPHQGTKVLLGLDAPLHREAVLLDSIVTSANAPTEDAFLRAATHARQSGKSGSLSICLR
jgi:hypothetical protein